MTREERAAYDRERNKRWRKNNPEKDRERRKRWKTNNPEKFKKKKMKYRLKKKYGITLLEYNSILFRQSGVCAICGNMEIGGKRLSVDHDHNSGNIRGLLCQSCNAGLGLFKENINSLGAAISYLMEYRASGAYSPHSKEI